MRPSSSRTLPDHLFRNDGGRFVDVTAEAGINDWHGQGLGVVATDLDDDGRIDLFVANDQSPNYFFHNLGEPAGSRRLAESSGLAGNGKGGFQAGMGVACGDLDGDGRPDLGVTNFYNESTTFYHNLGGGIFADHTGAIGLAVPTRYRLGFGTAFLDVEQRRAPRHRDRQRPRGRLPARDSLCDARPASPRRRGRAAHRRERRVPGRPGKSRGSGAAWPAGDLDNDGRIDLLLLAQDVPLAYFHNRSKAGHFVTLRLEGGASNRDAIGTRVTVTAGGRRQSAWRFGGGSYQSSSDPRLHIGLGDATRIESLEVAWPSGKVDRFGPLAADTGYLVREGKSEVMPLPGFTPPSSRR